MQILYQIIKTQVAFSTSTLFSGSLFFFFFNVVSHLLKSQIQKHLGSSHYKTLKGLGLQRPPKKLPQKSELLEIQGVNKETKILSNLKEYIINPGIF